MRTTTTTLAVAAALATPTAADAHSDLRVPNEPSGAQMRAHRTDLARRRLARTASRLTRKLTGRRLPARRIAHESPRALTGRIKRLRRALRRPAAVSPTLQAIAACESGGNPGTDTGNGFYGKYQFTLQTWASVGGTGNPAAASEAEQNQRAAMLYAREGAGPWPVCGR